ncbi:MAG TPA: hypothetical protein VJ824_12825 [Bacillota bacterium]|nr:hypothetical protein [Bacillota bacterium]
MKKIVSTVIAFFAISSILLTGCGQEKVIDTDFVRMQNKVKDLENLQKQQTDDQSKMNQKITDIQQTLKQEKDQISALMSTKDVKDAGVHPVIIQDVKISSEKMDSQGRVWGPFNVNVTLYNGTDQDISDSLSTMILSDSPNDTSDSPKVQSLNQKFEIKAKESKTLTFQDVPIGQPTGRMNVIVKLMESVNSNGGVPGKATWVAIPNVIFPPNS